MNRITFVLLLTLSSLMPINASELHIYQDPIPLADYVKDEPALFTKALARTGWTYDQVNDQQFARLSYKTYQINVELIRNDAGVALKLVDASRPDCGKKVVKLTQIKSLAGWLSLGVTLPTN